MATTVSYPPGVLHTFEVDFIGDDGEIWEITQFPDRPFWVTQEISPSIAPGYQYITTDHLAELKELTGEVIRFRVKDHYDHHDSISYAQNGTHTKMSEKSWDFNAIGWNCQRPWNWYVGLGDMDTGNPGLISALVSEHKYLYRYFRGFVDDYIEEALNEFEEDFDYEQWLETDVLYAEMKEQAHINRCYDPDIRCTARFTVTGREWLEKTGWVGQVVETMGDSVDNMVDEWKKLGRDPVDIKHIQQGQLGHVLLKDRYRIFAKMDRGPFAISDFGFIFIPPRMMDYLSTEPGQASGNVIDITVAKTPAGWLPPCKFKIPRKGRAPPAEYIAIFNH
jgi:hypothetical protein